MQKKLPQGGQLQRKVKIKWSSNFAYALGLLTADGCLSKDGRHIIFTSKEIELINLFKIALRIKNRPIQRMESTREWFYISFGDKVFYQLLLQLGLSPAKSKTIQSVKVPGALFADFLRGLYDGDGTFYTFRDTRWPNSFCYKMSFASSSLAFVEWLRQELRERHETKGYIHKGAGVYNLEYVKGDSRKIFNGIYYRHDLLFLPRKYHRIKNALEQDTLVGRSFLQKQRQETTSLPG